MKELNRTPVEIFCHDWENNDPGFDLAIRQQYCKYIKGTCVKPRKSEPEIKVGICSLAASVNNSNELYPVIICPQRFKEERMFETIRNIYLSSWKNVKWVKEVNMGVGGSVDYVAVELDERQNIKDFLCVEIQAAGTTGSPYPAVKEFIRDGHFSSASYNYGINWANEFTKTMMQQALKKGKIVKSWNRKIVFVVQDVAMKYLYSSSDCSLLMDSTPDLPVDFCSFRMNWEDPEWHLIFNDIKSTDIEGISRIIGGSAKDEYPSEEQFIANIFEKGLRDRSF